MWAPYLFLTRRRICSLAMKSLLTVATLAFATGMALVPLLRHLIARRNKCKKISPPEILWNGAEDLIGNTPMIRLPHLSKELRCTVLCKCEFMNPGGTPKDRIAQSIINEAEQSGYLRHDDGGDNTNTVYEGTVGSTGIALAWLCAARGYRCVITIPDDVAKEKFAMLQALGADVKLCRPAPITDRNHFVRYAEDLATGVRQEAGYQRGYFANQFENLANFRVHYERTGPEIYQQTGGMIDVLVLGGGTGGTLAGCSRYIKSQCPAVTVCLADPQGSGLYNKIRSNVFFTVEESEGKRRRQQVDTIVEGVGLQRMTRNVEMVLGRAKDIANTQQAIKYLETGDFNSVDAADEANITRRWIDDAIRVSDREAVLMARYMVRHEGLFLGSSSCVNLVAVVKLIKRWQFQGRDTSQLRIVTLLCDGGHRHLTKFWSDQFLIDSGLFSSDELHPINLRETVKNLNFINVQ